MMSVAQLQSTHDAQREIHEKIVKQFDQRRHLLYTLKSTFDENKNEQDATQQEEEDDDISLDALLYEANIMKNIINNAEKSAKQLVDSVKHYDRSAERIQEVMQQIDVILAMQAALKQVKETFEKEQYKESAKILAQALKGRKDFQNDKSYQELIKFREEIAQKMHKQLDEAKEKHNVMQEIEVAEVLPFVGFVYEGLEVYCRGIRSQVHTILNEKALTVDNQPPHSVMQHLECISQVFDVIARFLKTNVGKMQSCFGNGTQLRLLQEIYDEVNGVVIPWLKRFIEDKNVVYFSRYEIKSDRRTSTNIHSDVRRDPEPDPLTLDTLLDEISYVSRECELFDSNIRQLAKIAKSQLLDSDLLQRLVDSGHSLDFPHVTDLMETVQEIGGHYITIERTYMLLNVNKAIQIDEHVGDILNKDDEDIVTELKKSDSSQLRGLAAVASGMSGVVAGTLGNQATSSNSVLAQLLLTGIGLSSNNLNSISTNSKAVLYVAPAFLQRFGVSLTSTVVDDIFYILKKCTERALLTMSANIMAAVINNANSMLSTQYVEIFERAILTYQQKYGQNAGTVSGFAANLLMLGSAAASVTQALERKHQDDARLLVAINNLDVSLSHAQTLKRHLENNFKSIGFQQSLVAHCVNDLDTTCDKIRNYTNRGLSVVASAIGGRERQFFEAFNSIEYEINEIEYSDCELGDSAIQPLLDLYHSELMPLCKAMTDANFQTLLLIQLDRTVHRIEMTVRRKRFTFWGALRLDMEVRKLNNWFDHHSNRNAEVHDKFLRLVQISMLLQLDKPVDVLDYWADTSAVVWRLSEFEVRSILSQRSDWSLKEIQHLQLSRP